MHILSHINQLISDTKNFLSLDNIDEALETLNLIIVKDPNKLVHYLP